MRPPDCYPPGMKVTIIGAGVLGTALGVLLRQAGYEIAAICSRTKRGAQAAASLIGEGKVVGDPGLAAMGADLVLLAVPDREIPSVAIQVAAGGALQRGAVVAHLAGGLPARILSGVDAAGGHRGSMHPLQSFADVDTAIRMIPETFFFLEGDREAVEVLRSVVIALEGKPVPIDSESKALYHAGAAAASNYFVTLVDFAKSLLVQAGVPSDEALPALQPLVRGTLANLEHVGLPAALTGPIARGDVGTVRRHLAALRVAPGDVLRLYRELGRKTVELARKKGTIGPSEANALLTALAEDEVRSLPPDPAGFPPAP
jgi:predicted short-subunit dehydrogenase-like oxidoreductase (DUF2520 family)